jgi:hypothetical protein
MCMYDNRNTVFTIGSMFPIPTHTHTHVHKVRCVCM